MTSATDVLRNEHEAILKMLAAAEEVASRLDRREQVAPEVFSGLLEFFQLFADRCHHGKEEDLLFPLLVKKGMPAEGGPVSVMRFEHELGREFVRQMKESSDAYLGGTTDASQKWATAARGYVELLRQHISKENNILFPMAERLLSDAEQETLANEFEKVEMEKMGPGTHERLHARMDRLLAEIHAMKS